MKDFAVHFRKAFCLVSTIAFVIAFSALFPARAAGVGSPEPDSAGKTLSPYFFVRSEDPTVDLLPLKSTSAVVNIAGLIADVTVTQVYKNEGKKPLEALYVFPASTRAAVYGMKMTIGERTITAAIQKREDARKAYEEAIKEGKSASLLEQQRPNVFQMNVANIMPGDEIRTELKYTELLSPTDGIYEFVYPTVVGPRYSNQATATANPSEKWSQNPYLHEGESTTYSFDIKINMAGGVPIQEITCPSHRVNVHYRDKTTAGIELDSAEKMGGNRDFILKYRLSGEEITSGVLLFEGEKENFFLLMVQPPKRVSSNKISPREYIFIVDVSGSMNGFPLDISKKLMKDLALGLRPHDLFNVLLFAGGSELFSERSVVANETNIKRAIQFIERQSGSGGTELLPALKRAMAVPRQESISRTFVIATDGYVTVETESFDLIRKNIGNANFFTFGIGTSVNRHLLEGMARVGAGEPFVITSAAEAPAAAEKFKRYVQHPLLTGIKLHFGKFETYDVEPPSVPDIFAQRPAIIFGKWKGKPHGNITLYGKGAAESFEKSIDLSEIRPTPENSALPYLWARSKIAGLADYNNLQPSDERIGRITDLGLSYNLLTAYTSFVAIDSEVRRHGGESTTVKQPLPLPEGVSDLAVGGEVPSPAMSAPYQGFLKGGHPYGSKALEYRDSNDRPEPDTTREAATVSKLELEKLTVVGSLRESEVKKAFERHSDELLECLQQKGTVPVKMSLKWTIEADGSLSGIEVFLDGVLSKDLSDCFRKKLVGRNFPKPKDGREVRLNAILSISQ